MFVVKRSGKREAVSFDTIADRIHDLCDGLDTAYVDSVDIAQKVIQGIYDGISTAEIDQLAAETAAAKVVSHPDYGLLAGRLAVTKLHKETTDRFSDLADRLYFYTNPHTSKTAPMVSEEFRNIVLAHRDVLDAAIDTKQDLTYAYFGYKTLERSYLLRIDGKVAERPQQMIMRVAIGIHGWDLDSVLETYRLMSQKHFIHASPTLFHAGTPRPQLSSCFLLTMKEDSIEGIYDTLKTCAVISKMAGGIGLNVHCIRAQGTYISGTNGFSSGLVPMLRVFNNTARYVDQGGNKRPGAFAVYLEPWHSDVFDFLDLRKNHGKEEVRARELFYALWVPDLFMKRVEEDGEWTLMCPAECPGLVDVWGEEFEKLYESYEKKGKGKRTIKAQKLWHAILEAQTETGNPFLLYKDAANRKSNQQNVGTIKSSNLCTEIMEYSSPEEVAVCNLASIALPAFVTEDDSGPHFDFEKLHTTAKHICGNLNRIIDVNFYPVPEAKRSNLRHRPMGMGVQGLADTFQLLGLPFDSPEARTLNRHIFETIYHAGLERSCELAAKEGPYETYEGSPASKGRLQFDLWGTQPSLHLWDWPKLKDEIAQHGLRNSLLVAPMPTASTSQILGLNECFEPYTSNIYTRRTLAGEFQVVNPHLIRTLAELGQWSDAMKNKIIAHGGSVQTISSIPAEVRDIYRTVWEIPQRAIIDLAADRGAFIDQSQSLNLHLQAPTYGKLTSMHFYAWKRGLKTGCYYLRSRPAANAIQFTVDSSVRAEAKREQAASISTTASDLSTRKKRSIDGMSSSATDSPARTVGTATTSRASPGASSNGETAASSRGSSPTKSFAMPGPMCNFISVEPSASAATSSSAFSSRAATPGTDGEAASKIAKRSRPGPSDRWQRMLEPQGQSHGARISAGATSESNGSASASAPVPPTNLMSHPEAVEQAEEVIFLNGHAPPGIAMEATSDHTPDSDAAKATGNGTAETSGQTNGDRQTGGPEAEICYLRGRGLSEEEACLSCGS